MVNGPREVPAEPRAGHDHAAARGRPEPAGLRCWDPRAGRKPARPSSRLVLGPPRRASSSSPTCGSMPTVISTTRAHTWGSFPSPVIQSNLIASLPSEIPNRFLFWGTYGNLPHKVTLSPHIEYRNGFPYQPTNVYQQWVPLTGPQSRYPNYFSLDMRVSKDVQVNLQHAVRLSLTVRNSDEPFQSLGSAFQPRRSAVRKVLRQL